MENILILNFTDVDVVPIAGQAPGGSIVGIALGQGSIVGISPGI